MFAVELTVTCCLSHVAHVFALSLHSSDSEDEMCNFYVMYYTDNDGRSLVDDECWSSAPESLHFPNIEPPLTSPGQPHNDGSHEQGRREGSEGGEGRPVYYV